MKKKLLFISSLFINAITSFAQIDTIPNAKLDYWTGVNPTNWGTLNGKTISITVPITTTTTLPNTFVTKASGADILGINTVCLNTVQIGNTIVPGIAISKGSVNVNTSNQVVFSGGFSVTHRPYALTGVCKYNTSGSDSSYIFVVLTRWNTITLTKDTIGIGKLSPSNTTYKSFSIPIDYSMSAGNTNPPDSSQIILMSSNANTGGVATVGSKLFVDSLAFMKYCTVNSPTICQGQTATISASGATNYSWVASDLSNSSGSTVSYTPTSDISYTLTGNGCGNAVGKVTVIPSPIKSITAGGVNAFCNGTGGSCQVGGNYDYQYNYSSLANKTYLWSNGGTTNPITNISPGTYSVTVRQVAGGCTFSKTTTAVIDNSTAPTSTPICLVTVDPSSTHNIIVWEKPISAISDSFAIYMEVTTAVYSKIATVPYDSMSSYNDYSANPNSTSYKYKMKVVDRCGHESGFSDFHNTIHLQTLGGGNFQWTLYEIENQSNPVTYYKIYRDDNGSGNFQAISSTIPGTNTTYTDVNAATYPNALYYVEAVWNISCTPTRAVSSTRSNTKGLVATGVSLYNEIENGIKIYPNPASTSITLTLNELVGSANISIVNAFGEMIYTQTTSSKSNNINIENFAKGVYMVTVKIGMNSAFKKLIVN